jgi:hypothetical protein
MSDMADRNGRIGRVALALTAAGAALGTGALIVTRPFAEAAWEEAPPNPGSIYHAGGSREAGASAIPVVSPFHLHTDPMAGLLLINFERDPDRIYLGFEPQAFDDAVHGRGILVLGWRRDGRVDVFHDPELELDPHTYGIAGKGLHRMVERAFAGARFELGPAGAQLDLAFEDLEGREVRLVIRETDTRPRRPFGFLAPMGNAASNPPGLPLVFVNEFYFVRRAGTEVRIEIDGRSHRGDSFPLVLDGTRVHFLRYSADPFVVTWNPAHTGTVDTLDVGSEAGPGIDRAEARGVRYELSANGGFREIRRMSRRQGGHEVVVEFAPAIPHLLALRDGAGASGAFRISAYPPMGTVTGRWHVARSGRAIHLEAVPAGGWIPGDAPRMVRALFRVASMFRTWPTTYLWRGTLELAPSDPAADGAPSLHSAWQRIE